jgi:rod shape determining protein RodA
MSGFNLNHPDMTIRQRLWRLQWLFVFILCLTASIGFTMLYSAAGGQFEPWASRQMVRFCFGLVVMIAVAITNIKLWLRYAYVFYAASLVLLVAVEFGGFIGMGAQRWIDIGFISLQPSELMKIALVLALARYFHGGSIEDVSRMPFLAPPILMVVVPAVLVFRQPDLGTTLMLLIASLSIFLLAGVKLWKFGALAGAALFSLPLVWHLLRDYQKKRVMTFLDPESDPLGAGYHIIQSKIALGSGGVFGRGFLEGTQGNLSFLPEKQTDFIFTMLAEQFGLLGGLVLLTLYVIILLYGYAVSLSCRSQFGRLVVMGIITTFFLYVFINIAMVMGLVPVVGIPLPLISYGGTAMITLLFGFGLLLGVSVQRDTLIGRRGAYDDL